MHRNSTAHYEAGEESRIAFVFSCPGRYEEKENAPAKGQTGVNLEELLKYMRSRYGLKAFRRGKITITNAWSKVEYKKKMGRSEPKSEEVQEAWNIRRLVDELQHVSDIIICCGDKAALAVKSIENGTLNPKIVYIGHLGNRALNKTIHETLKEKTSWAPFADHRKDEKSA